MAPIASIIIPTYNRVDLLTQRSLKSALAQNFHHNFGGLLAAPTPLFEVIVVDDYSTDKTEEVVKRWQKKYKNLHYYKMPQNSGLSAVRNKGFSLAQGKYVACLDDDNELLPDFLKITIAKIELYREGVDAISVGKLIKYVTKNFEDYAPAYHGQKFMAMDWGFLFKREVFDNLQYDENCHANDDTDFGIQFFKKYRCIGINKPLGIAFDSENEKESLSFPSEREIQGMKYFMAKNEHEYTDPNEKRYLYRLMGRKMYKGGYKWIGLKYFWKSFWAVKRIEPLAHLIIILFGWWIYDQFMTLEERIGAKIRMKRI